MKKRLLPVVLFLFLLLFTLWPVFGAEPDFRAMLEEIDAQNTFEGTDFSCLYTFVSEKPDEDTCVFKARMFRRDADDKFLILILDPPVQKGQGYLMIDDNLWFYDPESRKFSHSSLKENMQDSEAKNSDMQASSLAQDYSIKSHSEGKLGKYPVYILDLEANNNEVTYPRLKLWIRQDRALVLKTANYSLSGRLMRTAYYPNYVRVQDRLIPSKMLFVDELKKGEKTQVTIKEASVADVPDTVFTKSYLERVNR